MKITDLPNNLQYISTQFEVKDIESGSDTDSSADNDYYFLMPTEKERINMKKLKDKIKRQRNLSQQSHKVEDFKSLRMKPINYENIYSEREKQNNQSLIDVFFDKQRNLKRHADGSRLIKQFVKPMFSEHRQKSISKIEVDQVIQKSYQKNFSTDIQLPKVKIMNKTSLKFNNNKTMMAIQLKRIESKSVMEVDESGSDIKNRWSQFGQERNQSLDKSSNYYEKDYTRISDIKDKMSSTRRHMDKSNYNSFLKDKQTKSLIQQSPEKKDFSQIRIIAPFIESHLKSNYTPQIKRKINLTTGEEKSKQFDQLWSKFNETTNNYSNFIQQSKFDQSIKGSPFKMVALRKQI